MGTFICGDRLRYGRFEEGSSGCLVRFNAFPDRMLMLTAGHVVLPTFAQQGDAIVDDDTGDLIGRLFSWTSIDGDPTADAALVWVDPSIVSPAIRGLGVPRGVNMNPAVGEQIFIAPPEGQQQARTTTIKAVNRDIDVLVAGPGWADAPVITYRRQILTNAAISQGGDSGAIALDAQGRVVGMVVATSLLEGTVITPIAPILANAAWGGLQLELVDALPTDAKAPPMPGVLPLPAPAAAPEQLPTTPDEFIKLIAPAAVESMHSSKVFASFTIAQSALESNWGRSLLAVKGKNLFGVKANAAWKGEVLEMQTREFVNDQWVSVIAKWRLYKTWLESLDDHARFFHENPRYAGCFAASDGEGFARAVAKAGYATDPDYAQKLIATMRARNLARFDTAGGVVS